jgi:acyl-coenzyme A thioesterase PaaI-like protein
LPDALPSIIIASMQNQQNNPLHKQPNSYRCFVCGIKNPFGLQLSFYDNGIDEVLCEYTIPDRYQGYPGIAHGGIVAAILDEVVGRVSMIGDHLHFMMTATMELKYRQPVPLNTPLKIVGRLLKDRGRVAKAEGVVYLPDGSPAVEATLMLANLPEQFTLNVDVTEELGWKVYPKDPNNP